jgi:uncharacterized membrane protein
MKTFYFQIVRDKSLLFSLLLCPAYIVFASTLAILQHDSFHTHAFDMGYFDNVLWNTSQGRFFVNDFPDKSPIFLGEHFSPALILVAPFYWLWNDARVLLVAQAIALGLMPLPCYLVVRRRHPTLAPFALLALYLNPALLGVALSEFHEIALAAPCVSWGLWAWLEKRSWVGLVIGLLVAVMAKEEVAVIVGAIGIYILMEQLNTKTQRHKDTPRSNLVSLRLRGMGLIIFALLWLVLVWGVVPRLLDNTVSHWQIRYGDIAPTPLEGAQRLLTNPVFLWERYNQPQKWWAVARTLWPLAFLPLLAPDLFALTLPVYAYLLLSNKASVSQLQVWYVTPLLPLLFMATAMALARAAERWARLWVGVLVVMSMWVYVSVGVGPLSFNYEPARFAVTERTQCGQRLLSLIPSDVSISAQDNLMPHLSHRRTLYVFPSMGEPLAEYVALDARYEVVGGHSNWPTVRQRDVPLVVNQFLAQPGYTLIGDACDYKVLRYTQTPLITHSLQKSFAGQIELMGYDLAIANEQGIYQSATTPFAKGRAVRVMLWWRATTKVAQDYTVFVHALNVDGQLVGQHDSSPANGFRATTTWTEGELVRDIHYFTLNDDASHIVVGLYDARTGQRVRVGEEDFVSLTR